MMKYVSEIIGKTALVLPPPWSPFFAPLGICTIGQIFRNLKIECRIFDWNIELLHELKRENGHSFNREHLLYWDEVYCSPEWKEPTFFKKSTGRTVHAWIERNVTRLIDDGYRTFGLSAFTTNLSTTSHIAEIIRSYLPDALIIIGGPATYDIIEFEVNHKWLSNADYIFYTESEESLPTLLKAITDRKKKVDIPGTAYLREDQSFYYTPRQRKPDPALIPPINYDDIDLHLYARHGIPVEFSRGCNGSCHFCSEGWRYKPYRPRPIKDVVRDFTLAADKYAMDYIFLICSTLNGDRAHLDSFCDALISNHNRIKWLANAHLDETLDAKLLTKMVRAGCKHLVFGLESAADHVLTLMNKHSNKKNAVHIIEICSEIGIKVSINLVVGYPGETEEDLDETIDFLDNYHKKIAFIGVNKCTVDAHASLGRNPGRFGIFTRDNQVVAVDPTQAPGIELPRIIPNGPAYEDWCTINGDNTPYIRNLRFKKILNFLDELKKPKYTPQESTACNEIPPC